MNLSMMLKLSMERSMFIRFFFLICHMRGIWFLQQVFIPNAVAAFDDHWLSSSNLGLSDLEVVYWNEYIKTIKHAGINLTVAEDTLI